MRDVRARRAGPDARSAATATRPRGRTRCSAARRARLAGRRSAPSCRRPRAHPTRALSRLARSIGLFRKRRAPAAAASLAGRVLDIGRHDDRPRRFGSSSCSFVSTSSPSSLHHQIQHDHVRLFEEVALERGHPVLRFDHVVAGGSFEAWRASLRLARPESSTSRSLCVIHARESRLPSGRGRPSHR